MTFDKNHWITIQRFISEARNIIPNFDNFNKKIYQCQHEYVSIVLRVDHNFVKLQMLLIDPDFDDFVLI